jgi:hypothetical protein
MSRTRAEKHPDRICGFDWMPADGGCHHQCQLKYQHETEFHYCCGAEDGSHDL